MAPEVSVMDIEVEEMIASSPGVSLSETNAAVAHGATYGRINPRTFSLLYTYLLHLHRRYITPECGIMR